MTEFTSHVADLLHRPGARRPFLVDAPLEGLVVGGTRVDGPVHGDLVLEQVPDGVVVRGTASGTWGAECSRCLTGIERSFTVALGELFEANPVEGETYPIVDEVVDLDPPLRDAIAGVLPVAPLCRDDCAGLCPVCGIDRNSASCSCDLTVADHRWDALNALKFDNENTN